MSPSSGRSQPRRKATEDGLYIVQPNDTAWDIARSFEIELQTLLAANVLTVNSVITPGQLLVIPEATDRRPSRASEGTGHPPATYRVRTGDTLYGIARRFGTSVDELRSENRIRGNRIMPGEILRIPGGNSRG